MNVDVTVVSVGESAVTAGSVGVSAVGTEELGGGAAAGVVAGGLDVAPGTVLVIGPGRRIPAMPKKIVAARLIIDTVVGSAVDTSSFSFLMMSVARAEMMQTPAQTVTMKVARVSVLTRGYQLSLR